MPSPSGGRPHGADYTNLLELEGRRGGVAISDDNTLSGTAFVPLESIGTEHFFDRPNTGFAESSAAVERVGELSGLRQKGGRSNQCFA
ncbi:hypothetical protein CA85_50660 [Allorhodopirellula solitaria]|uniref:Uncharacterized protein n=1 Tax=Allorhodopirellula solitaria TaxID=2527987 RepID=A0A5C5WQT2_9BACT|nr:hypothetical protein CA85_50660 [Allorhodopirellula solitaria]